MNSGTSNISDQDISPETSTTNEQSDRLKTLLGEFLQTVIEVPKIPELDQLLSTSFQNEPDAEASTSQTKTRRKSAHRPIKCVVDEVSCTSENSPDKPTRPRLKPKSTKPKDHSQKGTSGSPKEKSKPQLNCRYCDKTFHSKMVFDIHEASHFRAPVPSTCEICHKEFSSSFNLRRHMKTHEENRQLEECEVCHKKLSDKYELTRHMQIHEDVRPHQCQFCDSKFRKAAQLRVHEMRHKGIKPWSCSECDRSFVRESELKEHMRVHTGECPYECDKCGKKFKQSTQLRTHQKMHENERVYKCEECGQAFNYKSGLIAHKKTYERSADSHSTRPPTANISDAIQVLTTSLPQLPAVETTPVWWGQSSTSIPTPMHAPMQASVQTNGYPYHPTPQHPFSQQFNFG